MGISGKIFASPLIHEDMGCHPFGLLGQSAFF
jgi:hypothetical protein